MFATTRAKSRRRTPRKKAARNNNNTTQRSQHSQHTHHANKQTHYLVRVLRVQDARVGHLQDRDVPVADVAQREPHARFELRRQVEQLAARGQRRRDGLEVVEACLGGFGFGEVVGLC